MTKLHAHTISQISTLSSLTEQEVYILGEIVGILKYMVSRDTFEIDDIVELFLEMVLEETPSVYNLLASNVSRE